MTSPPVSMLAVVGREDNHGAAPLPTGLDCVKEPAEARVHLSTARQVLGPQHAELLVVRRRIARALS
jgi:hypothetical protein